MQRNHMSIEVPPTPDKLSAEFESRRGELLPQEYEAGILT